MTISQRTIMRIYNENVVNGRGIGDLFCSLFYMSNTYTKKNDEKIYFLTHQSLHKLIEYLFGWFVDGCISEFSSEDHVLHIHHDFVAITKMINFSPKIILNPSVLADIPDSKLLPNNSTLLIFNRSDNHVFSKKIIADILSCCDKQSTFIRNVVDNKIYEPSYIKHDDFYEYNENLMCLIKSCAERNIRIIANRCGLCDMLGYISPIKLLMIFMPFPDWINNFTFKHHHANPHLNKLITAHITEYDLLYYKQTEFIDVIKKFLRD